MADIIVWGTAALFCALQAVRRARARLAGVPVVATPDEQELQDKAAEMLVEALTPPSKRSSRYPSAAASASASAAASPSQSPVKPPSPAPPQAPAPVPDPVPVLVPAPAAGTLPLPAANTA